MFRAVPRLTFCQRLALCGAALAALINFRAVTLLGNAMELRRQAIKNAEKGAHHLNRCAAAVRCHVRRAHTSPARPVTLYHLLSLF